MIPQSSLKYFAGAVLLHPPAGAGASTAYVSHDSHDRKLAAGLQAYLIYHGWRVNLAWDDGGHGNAPAGRIAEGKKRMISANAWFLYLATDRSERDHWCQWELTFAGSVKRSSRILIVPTSEGDSKFGERHLRLHRYISRGGNGVPLVHPPGGGGNPLPLSQIDAAAD